MIVITSYSWTKTLTMHYLFSMAQWVRSLDLTAHTSLSPIQRGFAPGFVKGALDLQPAASDKVYQLLVHGRWFSLGTVVSSTTKTGRQDITESGIKTPKIKSNKSFFTQKYLWTLEINLSIEDAWIPLTSM